MSETLLSPKPPQRTSLDYAALRKGGLELIRSLAGETWTDHNVHDPGITLLEAFSYAMTELGFRVQLDMGDLLKSGEARAPTALEPAHLVLPSGPVTHQDLRKLLLDHPLAADALIAAGAESEIAFYEVPAERPPFSYEPVSPDPALPPRRRAQPRGLSEVLVAFAEDDPDLPLNSNTYDLEVGTVAVEIALPHWDEEEATLFRQGATATAVDLVPTPVGLWRPLPEPLTYYGELDVQTDGGPNVLLWAVLRITDPVEPADLPGVLLGAEAAAEATGSDTLIDRFTRRVQAADAAIAQIGHYVGGWRNLCEQESRLASAREQEIAIGARIEVTGGTDLEELLADIFLAVDRQISPPLLFHSLEQMRAGGGRIEEIFDGPLLAHGFLNDDELRGLARPSAIFVSDILRLIMQQRGAGEGDVVAQENPSGRHIVALTELRLSNFVNNRPITTNARDCLRLVDPQHFRPRLSIAKSQITFVRDDLPVPYDIRRVESLFQEGRLQDREAAAIADPSPLLPAPPGEALPLEDYYAFQNDLPRLYGLGEAGLAEGASAERKARALQAKGYLILFEQFLSDLTAQLGHVNRFFSPDPDEPATYFTRPLLDLAGVEEVLLQTPEEHSLALQEAVESRERFLDRRNRMLDHLLARLGEQTVAWGQELHRWGQAELAVSESAPLDLPAAIAERRQAVNARLIRDKAAFLRDTPELAAFRLQAFGSILQRQPGLLQVSEEEAGGVSGFRWSLGPDLLRSPELFASERLAWAAGAEAAALSAGANLYRQSVIAGQRRYRLRVGTDPGARIVGESPTTFPSAAAAVTAMLAASNTLSALRLDLSLTPFERRVAHLTGIRSQLRRSDFLPSDQFFDVLDTAGGDGRVDGWRLRDGPAAVDQVLVSADTFPPGGEPPAASDAEASDLARQAIGQVIRHGTDEWSYRVAGDLRVELVDPSGAVLGRSPGSFASVEEGEAAITALAEHLYRSYGGERLHLVEHLLLRPRQANDRFLDLPVDEAEAERDPYSQRLTVVLPSGWARDFPDEEPEIEPPPPTPVTPHRFRDLEFRRHAERMVRQACPAHLLPTILWVDRDLATVTNPATTPRRGSFEEFELRYIPWLRSLLFPGIPPTDVRTIRNRLVRSLDAIHQEAFQ